MRVLQWNHAGDDDAIEIIIMGMEDEQVLLDIKNPPKDGQLYFDLTIVQHYIIAIDTSAPISWQFDLFNPKRIGEASASTIFGDGIHSVGVDIELGTYLNSDSSNGCYWARLSGFSGELKDVIANNFSYDVQIVTVSTADVGFESSRCGTWTRAGS